MSPIRRHRNSKFIVPGLIKGWKSDHNIVVDGGNLVISVDDLVRLAASGPQLVANAFGNKQGIRFAVGVDTRLQTTVPSLDTATDFTSVTVHTPYVGGTAAKIASTTMYDVWTKPGIHLNIGNGSIGDARVGGFYDGAAPNTNAIWRGNSVNNVPDIVIGVRSGGVVTFYKNGGTLTPTQNDGGGQGAIATSLYTVGGDKLGNIGAGTWFESRLYDHALTAIERAALFNDLGATYGIPIVATSGTALNRAGWVASAWADGGGGFVPASAIDGNRGSRYLSAANPVAGVAYFKLDLGSAQTVGGVQVDNAPDLGGGWAQPVAGNIQYSDDNLSWTTVANWTLLQVNETVGVSWTPSSHRYWRLLAQGGSSDGGWWSIGEINLYSDAAP